MNIIKVVLLIIVINKREQGLVAHNFPIGSAKRVQYTLASASECSPSSAKFAKKNKQEQGSSNYCFPANTQSYDLYTMCFNDIIIRMFVQSSAVRGRLLLQLLLLTLIAIIIAIILTVLLLYAPQHQVGLKAVPHNYKIQPCRRHTKQQPVGRRCQTEYK